MSIKLRDYVLHTVMDSTVLDEEDENWFDD